ncbi:MAG TPA: ATP-binding protein [Roseiflexaceae bacterium]|nr:ATP-binding protein [Roseiflexaceae bacterium]
MLDWDVLRGLAPLELPTYRKERFGGDALNVSLRRFSAADRQSVAELYTWLQDLLALVQHHLDEPVICQQKLHDFAEQRHWFSIMARVRAIHAPEDDDEDMLLNKVIHDIKGGAFQSIVMYLQLMEHMLLRAADVFRIFVLVRDHLKIMRSTISDLDPQGYARDHALRLHPVDLLVQKWNEAAYRVQDKQVEIVFDCGFSGDVSERCLEFAALDRVVYNLVNNAARNADDGRVFFSILPLPDDHARHLRFVISNHVPAEHAIKLRERYADHLGDLFEGGFTTGGTGLGMRICADIVGNAYGVPDVEQCIQGGYVGAGLIDSFFVNWFHWPAVGD